MSKFKFNTDALHTIVSEETERSGVSLEATSLKRACKRLPQEYMRVDVTNALRLQHTFKVFDKLVHSRGGAVECQWINEAQWNNQLKDLDIVVNSDLSGEMYYTLVASKERMEKAMPKNKARMKKYKKTMIGLANFFSWRNVFDCLCVKNPSLTTATAKDMIAMDEDTRNHVLLYKVLEAVANGIGLDIEEYLTRLSEEELNDGDFIVSLLSSRKTGWKQRVQAMHHMAAHLADDGKYDALLTRDKCGLFVTAMVSQMRDDRSEVSGASARLLPSIVTTIIDRMQTTDVFLVDDHSVLSEVFDALFFLLHRANHFENLYKMAQISAVRVVDILAKVGKVKGSLDLLSIVAEHSVLDYYRVRAECVTLLGFLLFGVNSDSKETESLAMRKKPVRDYLLKSIEFRSTMAAMIDVCVYDTSFMVRRAVFKLLAKIENYSRSAA